MGEQKKSSKAGRGLKARSAIAYKSGGRRYVNKLRKVRKHIKRCGDETAKKWLAGAMKIYSMDYQRGSEAVRQLHNSTYGRHTV